MNRFPKSIGKGKSGAGKLRPLQFFFGKPGSSSGTCGGGSLLGSETFFHCGDLVIGRRWQKKVFA